MQQVYNLIIATNGMNSQNQMILKILLSSYPNINLKLPLRGLWAHRLFRVS